MSKIEKFEPGLALAYGYLVKATLHCGLVWYMVQYGQ